jgi:hypothetical protein
MIFRSGCGQFVQWAFAPRPDLQPTQPLFTGTVAPFVVGKESGGWVLKLWKAVIPVLSYFRILVHDTTQPNGWLSLTLENVYFPEDAVSMLLRNIKHLPDYTVSSQNHVILISCAVRISISISASKTSVSMTVGLCVSGALQYPKERYFFEVFQFFFRSLVVVIGVLLNWRWERGTSGIMLRGETRSMEDSNESA